MGKRWRIHPHDSSRVAQLENKARIPAVVAQLLVCRGIDDPDKARRFLDPKLSDLRDPEELPGVPEAVERITSAIKDKRRIIIYGDYDADGMTATSILYSCLQLLGGDVGYYVPNRLNDGYGLSDEALKKLAQRGASLVVTVDCGITSFNQAETACKLGIELIITDHHQPDDRLPVAAAIVHPRLPGRPYPFGELCGAGVAFKLAWALCQRASNSKKVGQSMRNFLLKAIGLTALATIADVVPLVDENRVLVRHGLIHLKQNPTPGIASMMKVCGLHERPQLDSDDIGFVLAPRLNAAGRLGQAQLGVELLTTELQERAESLADYIHELNNSRDSLQRKVYSAAIKQLKEQFNVKNDPAFVLAGRGWHPGVIGIVAGRIAEKYNRPTVLIALDEFGGKPGTGSARSIKGLHLHTALAACQDHLLSHGGHSAAAGLTIDSSHVDAFRTDFCEHVSSEISEKDRMAELQIDAETPFSQLTLKTLQQIEQLAPFGHGNSRPVFFASGVELAEPPRRMGKGERHLSVKLRQHDVALRAIAFGQGDWAEELSQVKNPFEVAYRPVINHFRGRRNVEIQLVDWRVVKDRVSTPCQL